MVELCRRYSNRQDLIDPLVSVLDKIKNKTANTDDELLSVEGKQAGVWRITHRLAVWFGKEQVSARRRRQFLDRHSERSVAGIAARIDQERVQELAATAETEVFAAVPAADQPTERLPAVPALLPTRVRRHIRQPLTPYPRKPLQRPDPALMQRVLEGLKRL